MNTADAHAFGVGTSSFCGASTMEDVEIRPARRGEASRAAEMLARLRPAPGMSDAAGGLIHSHPDNQILAVRAGEIVGSCLLVPGAGRCAMILVPRLAPMALAPTGLARWDERTAARLLRAAAARAYVTHDARLIQALAEPEAESPVTGALKRAGFAPLAVLAYLRRPVGQEKRGEEAPTRLTWKRYSRWRHRTFAQIIEQTYEGSRDCPGLAGLRTVDDVIRTHKATGTFRPSAWHLAIADRNPVGIVLVNPLGGRGELVYLGVVPEARGRGLGRTLLARAIADTARMGLPVLGLAVDVENEPAMRLYFGAGFKEIRRRMTWFIPKERLEGLAKV